MNECLAWLMHNRIQIFSVLGSALMFFFIISLIKRRKLKEEFAILWLMIFATFLVISIFKPILEMIAKVAGIYYPPAALLLLLILGIMMILVHYSMVITKLSEQNKLMAQELALLKHRVDSQKSQSLNGDS